MEGKEWAEEERKKPELRVVVAGPGQDRRNGEVGN